MLPRIRPVTYKPYTYPQRLNWWHCFGDSQLQQGVDDMGRHSVYLKRVKPTPPELSRIQVQVDTDTAGERGLRGCTYKTKHTFLSPYNSF